MEVSSNILKIIYKNTAITFFILFFCSLNFRDIKANSFKVERKFNSDESINNLSINKTNKVANNIKWENHDIKNNRQNPIWEKLDDDEFLNIKDILQLNNKAIKKSIRSHNRSIVIDNRVGPDISWLFPPGFIWNDKYKFDFNIRGHNSAIPDPPNRKFLGWNNGDAVGLFSYQFLDFKKSSFGINFGVRSLYQGDQSIGGDSKIGEGVSAGFRWDYKLSETSGIAFGAEQLVHFDSLTDTGRNIYITTSKGWWSSKDGNFPLYIATAGIGTGRMAVGTVKGLCADILDGAGTEIRTRRNLCWAPIFSLARVWNEKFSSFFEYNSRFFLLGTSLAPIEKIPVRGTFALMLSDHIDNYKLNGPNEINWVFNLSLGF